MTTLLQPPANNVFSNTLNGLPTLDEPSQLWLNPLNISQDSKDSLIQSLREQQERTEQDLHTAEDSDAHASSTRKPRRSSRAYVSRDNVSPERARHLERNRIAANKCRKKKKKEHEQIQSILHVETAKRETLLAQVNVLKEEVWQLKNMMFEHADCADQKINLQLAMMTQNMLGANIDALKCPSPTFSASTWSDGSAGEGDGDSRKVESSAPQPIADPVPDFQDGLFESFIDVPSM
ncbi:hypothetical protein N7523_010802 [Penicillium sp. IBT 18751x]|nr:hypothetical protein N7523_010802 [Penicillium sp. IBT 18751x]